jgi:hypothetical protein
VNQGRPDTGRAVGEARAEAAAVGWVSSRRGSQRHRKAVRVIVRSWASSSPYPFEAAAAITRLLAVCARCRFR